MAEELHFGRAAKRLDIAQPPLSQQIRHLEEELGVQLFHRTKRRVALTDAGRLFLDEARKALRQAERAVEAARRASRGEIGQLVVGFAAPADINVLPKILAAFGARFPDVQLILHLLSGAEQVEALHDGRLNVGVLRLPVDDDTLLIEPLLKEPFVIVLPEGHPLAAYRRVPLQALANERYIFFPRRQAPRLYDTIVAFCRRAGVSLNVSQESEHMHTTLSLVSAGLGVSLMPASVQHLARKGTVYRPLRSPVPYAEMGMAYRGDAQSAVLRAFLAVARATARARFK